MKILAVDNEIPSLTILERAIREAVPSAELHSFSRTTDAVREIRENDFLPDVAFLDIEMPGITGLELAKVLKVACPAINVVFVTGFSQYAIEAMAQRPSGYVMKPATKEKILEELKNLRNPPKRTQPPKPVRVQCFGSFELLVRGQPVQFLRAKSKELLAYLVDRRGASCSASEIASVLWEDGVYDRSRQKQLAVIRADLVKSLALAGVPELLIKGHDSLAVDTKIFDCDYYMALEGDTAAVNAYMGEYMVPYAWAEYTTGGLTAKYGTSSQNKS